NASYGGGMEPIHQAPSLKFKIFLSSEAVSTVTPTTSTLVTTSTSNCSNGSIYSLYYGFCVARGMSLNISFLLIANYNVTPVNISVLGNALEDYYTALDSLTSSSLLLSANVMDTVVGDYLNSSITRNANSIFLITNSPILSNNTRLRGGVFNASYGGGMVTNSSSTISQIQGTTAAAVINDTQELQGVSLIKLLFLDQPSNYLQYDTNTTKLASSVIIVTTTPRINNTGVTLYFTLKYNINEILSNPTNLLQCSFWNGVIWDNSGCQGQPTIDNQIVSSTTVYRCDCTHFTTFALTISSNSKGIPNSPNLICSFWDGAGWNSSGCDAPKISTSIVSYSSVYQCNCSHFTTFALIWLPLNEINQAGQKLEQGKERRKKVILVLLSACITQSLAWIFGPFLRISYTAALAIEWIFIVCNGLEGVWAILLYLLVRRTKTKTSTKSHKPLPSAPVLTKNRISSSLTDLRKISTESATTVPSTHLRISAIQRLTLKDILPLSPITIRRLTLDDLLSCRQRQEVTGNYDEHLVSDDYRNDHALHSLMQSTST
ncbi:unnamed protein product, partial [Didymodactylos carnosus]